MNTHSEMRHMRIAWLHIVRRWSAVALTIAVGAAMVFYTVNALFPLAVNIKYSQIVTARDGSVLHAFLSDDDKWRMKTELDEIQPNLRQALIEKEDRFFRYHPGINPYAIARAAYNNMSQGAITSGASTITMQVARLLEPKPRTYGNKIIEMFRALQLEVYYTKDEILQMYLNLAPYGGNVEGVKAASLLYFGRPPHALSLAQVVTLTIVPNRPTSLKLGAGNPFIRRARDMWLRRFRARGVFPTADVEDALREPVDAYRRPAPAVAPHFARRMKRRHPFEPIIRTQLDLKTQEQTQALAYNYSKRLKIRNIHNASVIVIDNADRSVAAYVGSFDFHDDAHAGQVDGVRAVRSPGSALKPLAYALAIDRGKATPKTVMTDVPVNYDGYRPMNFDRSYHGVVTVEQALAFSLNVPAVKILHAIGVEVLLDALNRMEFRQIRADRHKLGLSSILGGCGVRLEELAGMYAALADGGLYRPLRWTPEERSETQARIFSPAAAFLITEILTKPMRPDLPNKFESSLHVPKVAWKTGTSYGRRDAWSIGFNKRFTIAVWVGNFSGRGQADLTGADIATPLLFKIFNALDHNSANRWYAPPEELDFRHVCAESGRMPGDLCDHLILDYYIPAVSDALRCDHNMSVMIAPDGSTSYCTTCAPNVGFKRATYPNYPAELIAHFENEGITYAKAPPHNPQCTRIFSEHAPLIASPVEGKEYLLEKAEEQVLALECNAHNDVGEVYWFVNDRLVRSAAPNESVFFAPGEGRQKISCSDDKGRNSDIWITVTLY